MRFCRTRFCLIFFSLQNVFFFQEWDVNSCSSLKLTGIKHLAQDIALQSGQTSFLFLGSAINPDEHWKKRSNNFRKHSDISLQFKCEMKFRTNILNILRGALYILVLSIPFSSNSEKNNWKQEKNEFGRHKNVLYNFCATNYRTRTTVCV